MDLNVEDDDAALFGRHGIEDRERQSDRAFVQLILLVLEFLSQSAAMQAM